MDQLLAACHAVAVAAQRANPWEPMDTLAAGYVTWPDWERLVLHSEAGSIHWQEIAFYLRRWSSRDVDQRRFDDTLRRFANEVSPQPSSPQVFLDTFQALRGRVNQEAAHAGPTLQRPSHHHRDMRHEPSPAANHTHNNAQQARLRSPPRQSPVQLDALASAPPQSPVTLSPSRRALAVGLGALQNPSLPRRNSSLIVSPVVTSPRVPPPAAAPAPPEPYSIWASPVAAPAVQSPYLLNPHWQPPQHARLQSPERPERRFAPASVPTPHVVMTPRSTSAQQVPESRSVSDVIIIDRGSDTASVVTADGARPSAHQGPSDLRQIAHQHQHQQMHAQRGRPESSNASGRSAGPQTPGPARRSRLRVRDDPQGYA